jgi:transcriptional regulator with XRE-family HTH domain
VKRIGEKLHALRVRHGYTARELAEMLGVSHTHILRMEKGEKGPSANLVLKISQLFNVSADQLLRDDLELDN